jgi:hypothetical protein
MRVRMIRPAYWTDADLHTRLTAEQREFYIGLWMLADDGGYVSWDVERVGAELYPYRSPAWRRTRLPLWVTALAAHVRILECGRHLVVPNLPKYQNPPKPSYPNRRAHEACHVAPYGASWGQVAPARGFSKEGGLVGREGKGIEGGAPPRENGASTDEPTEFALKVVRPA